MSDRKQLMDYLLGALGDSETDYVHARLRHDPVYRQELEIARRQVQLLRAARPDFTPPTGLARRTCEFVFAHARRLQAQMAKRWAMTPHPAIPSWVGRVRWLDVAVTAMILVMATLVIMPAIQASRIRARLMACQDNLRQMGLALTGYSQKHQDCFPEVPSQGKLAGAGAYAPMLMQEGFLTEPQRFVCPDSPMASQKGFHVPTVEELQAACDQDSARLRQQMGGSYGYCLGHLERGVYVPTKNLSRPHFALIADAPAGSAADRQSINHGGRGQNVLFEDGHVEFMPNTQPSPGSDDIFANDNHLVSAGVHAGDSVIGGSDTLPIINVNYR